MNVVLVIADDMALIESLRATLPDTDLVLVESTVDDALRRLITLQTDVILIDDTPSLGSSALTRIREAAPAIPVVMLTGRGDNETYAVHMHAGAFACVSKPFSCDDLREQIGAAVRKPQAPAPEPHAHYAAPAPFNGYTSQYQIALRWLSRIAGHISDRKRLSESLIDALTDVYDAARCAVVLEEWGSVRIMASRGIPPTIIDSLRLGFDSGIMHWFEVNACLLDRSVACPSDAHKEMHVVGMRLGAPLIRSGRVCGALLVGDKASALDYTPEERELFSMIARSTSIALENTERYLETAHQRRRLDAVLTTIASGVVVIRPDKTVSMMNRSAEHMLQLRGADVVDRSVQKLGSGFADVVLRTLQDGKPRTRQEIRDAAINATLGLSATPLDDGGVVVIFSILPEEKASTEEIAYSPFWEYLASRVAQEIKNPMVAISTFAQLLPRKYDSPEFREAYSTTVQNEINRINSVVDTLYDFARHPRLMTQRCDLNETVENVLKSFEDELAERHIEVETSLDPEHPDANIDPIYFSQAIHNVLQNSIEAMPQGGVLRVQTQKGEEGCDVVISDSGPGVSEHDAPLIFMPFYSTKEQGMGLGLTLANRIAQQHHGELHLISNDLGGGAFKFHLPLSGRRDADDSSGR